MEDNIGDGPGDGGVRGNNIARGVSPLRQAPLTASGLADESARKLGSWARVFPLLRFG